MFGLFVYLFVPPFFAFYQVQFGHAGASAHNDQETAVAKNKVPKNLDKNEIEYINDGCFIYSFLFYLLKFVPPSGTKGGWSKST